jgi:hypothetical protein
MKRYVFSITSRNILEHWSSVSNEANSTEGITLPLPVVTLCHRPYITASSELELSKTENYIWNQIIWAVKPRVLLWDKQRPHSNFRLQILSKISYYIRHTRI